MDIEFQCQDLEIEILWIKVLKPRVEVFIFVDRSSNVMNWKIKLTLFQVQIQTLISVDRSSKFQIWKF